jgi:phosphoglycolate phosphatase
VLERLRQAGVRLSVSTNKPRALSTAILEGLGLAGHFVAVVGGDSLPTRKPDPASVRVLADRVGVALAETLLVGDSTVDVATARSAGVPVCVVTWGLTRRAALEAASPDYVVDRPEEILPLVARC